MSKTKRDENVWKRTKKDNFVLEIDIWAVDNGIIEKFYQSKRRRNDYR